MSINRAAVFRVVTLVCALLLGACTPSLSGRAYDRYEARQAQQVELGTVEHVRTVQIQGTQSGLGTAAGGVAGGIAGSAIGHGGRVQALGALGGAVLGGLAGAAIEEGGTRATGQEITVRTYDGRLLAIVQEADEAFYPGERVRILTTYDGSVRVTH